MMMRRSVGLTGLEPATLDPQLALGGWPRVELGSRSSARRCPQTARLNRCGRLGAKSALTASKPCLLGRPCRHDCGMDLTGDGHAPHGLCRTALLRDIPRTVRLRPLERTRHQRPRSTMYGISSPTKRRAIESGAPANASSKATAADRAMPRANSFAKATLPWLCMRLRIWEITAGERSAGSSLRYCTTRARSRELAAVRRCANIRV